MVAKNKYGETISKPFSFSTVDGNSICKQLKTGIPGRPKKMQCIEAADTKVVLTWQDSSDLKDSKKQNYVIEYRKVRTSNKLVNC